MKRIVRATYRCGLLWLALVFGRYQHSGWSGVHDYHSYEWRGQRFAYVCPAPEDAMIAERDK